VGAFFSIALGIRGRTVLPDLRRVSNITDAGLRVIIGFIGGSALMALITSKAVRIGLGDVMFDAQNPATTWLFVLIVGFLAGFSERLVPDLLAKTTASTQPSPPPAQALPAAEAGRAAAPGAAPAVGVGLAAEVAPPGAADMGQPVEEPAPHEAVTDHCVCDIELKEAEVTHDGELPAASGGGASAEGGQPR